MRSPKKLSLHPGAHAIACAGGWFPIALSVLIFLISAVWFYGRLRKSAYLKDHAQALESVLKLAPAPGCAHQSVWLVLLLECIALSGPRLVPLPASCACLRFSSTVTAPLAQLQRMPAWYLRKGALPRFLPSSYVKGFTVMLWFLRVPLRSCPLPPVHRAEVAVEDESEMTLGGSRKALLLAATGERVTRVPGVGLVFSDTVTGVPPVFTKWLENISAVHECTVLVTIRCRACCLPLFLTPMACLAAPASA